MAEPVKDGFAVVAGDEYLQHERPKPTSHMCCGCCCDTRKAVIVVNIISLCFGTLGFIFLAALTSDSFAEQFDDDATKTALGEIDGQTVGAVIAFGVVSMICYAAGIYGASKFNKIGVLIAAVWYSVDVVLQAVSFNFGGIILNGFFLYPHVVLYQEISKGIMSPTTYDQEKQCCSC